MSNKSAFLIRDMPPHLRAQFKAAAARRGRSMRAVTIELLRAYVARPGLLAEFTTDEREIIRRRAERGASIDELAEQWGTVPRVIQGIVGGR